MSKQVKFFSEKGKLSTECKDTIYFRETGEFGFYSLADGLNSRMFSHIGAKAVQKALADEWEKAPEKFFEVDNKEIKKRFVEIIHEVLYNLTDDKDSVEVFASTLMVVFVSRKHNRYKWVHIGDGIIIKENCWGEREIISYEQNGITSRYTFATTSNPLSRYLHIGGGNMNLIHRFILLTDGALSPIYKDREINSKGNELLEKSMECYHNYLRQLPIKDDYSMLDVWV